MMNKIIREIADERARQQDVEGWTPHHDDEYVNGELARAASVYAATAGDVSSHNRICQQAAMRVVPWEWPWHPEHFKPSTPRRDLVKAGALIVAEIERQDREAGHSTDGSNDCSMRTAVALREDDDFVYDDINALIADQAKDGHWQVGDIVTYWRGSLRKLTASELLAPDIDHVGYPDLGFTNSILAKMGRFVETYYPDAPNPFPNFGNDNASRCVSGLRARINQAIDDWADQNGLQPCLQHMPDCGQCTARIVRLDPLEVRTVHITEIDNSKDDDGGWNLEGSGLPSSEILYRALVAWLTSSDRSGSARVQEAAIALSATDDVITQVADMYDALGLDRYIGAPSVVYLNGDPDLIRANLSDHYWYSAVQCLSIGLGSSDPDTGNYIGATVEDVARDLGTTKAHVRSVCSGPYLIVGKDDRIEHEGE